MQSPSFPHIQGWINGTYPGTGICVSEYNVPHDGGDGSTPDPTTAAQLADILGMYGRLGYQVAAYWGSLVHGHAPADLQRDGDVPELRREGRPVRRLLDRRRQPQRGGQRLRLVGLADEPDQGLGHARQRERHRPEQPLDRVQNFTPTGAAGLPDERQRRPAAGAAVTITNGSITGFSLPSNSIALLVMSK